jgi:hypothetical protein
MPVWKLVTELLVIRRDGMAFFASVSANPRSFTDPAVQAKAKKVQRQTHELTARVVVSSRQWAHDHGFKESANGNIISTADPRMRTALAFILWIAFGAYSVTWLIVALASDPTWWWFAPIYGDIKIFEASVWWGLFHIGIIPAVIVVGLFMWD